MEGQVSLQRLVYRVTKLATVFLFIIAPLFTATAAEPGKNYPSVTLWPLAYHYEDTQRSRTDVIWPIYHQKREGSHHRLAIRPFLFNLETDSSRDFRQINFLWPLTHFEFKKETFKKWIFPVYYQAEDAFESTLMIWPFYGHSQKSDGTESWSTLYPFFQYRRSQNGNSWSADYLWPLGKSYRQRETSGGYLMPIWWRKSSPTSSGGYLFPYFWHTTETSKKKAIVPLWYSSRDDATATDYALLWYSRRQEEAHFKTLFPLFWQWRSKNDNHFTLIPAIYWSSKIKEQRLDILFPFYFRHDNLKYQTALRYYFPFYGDYRTGDHIRSRYFLFPLYIKIDDLENQRKAWYFLWPLVFTEKTPESFQSWAVPFYWTDQRPEKESRMILGLYWANRQPDNKFTLLVPFYLHTWTPEVETRHYVPFYSDIHLASGYRKTFYLGPLAITTDDPAEDRQQLDILWPLLSKKQKGVSKHFRVLPFYWHDEKPDKVLTIGSLALLPPYYLRYESDNRKDFHLWPFYGHEQDSSYQESSVAWPLFRWGSNPEGDRSAWQMLLAYKTRSPEKNMWGFFPLWHYDQTPDKTRNISLLHWQESSSQGDQQFSLLHLGDPDWSLFSIRSKEDERHHHLFPLYSYSANQAQDSSRFYLLGPLYFHQRAGAESATHQLLWKVLYSERTTERKESGFLWRLIRSKKDAAGSLFEFNPFYYGEKRNNGESFTSWFGGVYAVRKNSAGSQHKLFWLINW